MAANRDRTPTQWPVNHDEAAQCQGKVRLPNGASAWRAASEVNGRKRKGKRNPHARVYRCPHCGGWHFGQMVLRGKGPC